MSNRKWISKFPCFSIVFRSRFLKNWGMGNGFLDRRAWVSVWWTLGFTGRRDSLVDSLVGSQSGCFRHSGWCWKFIAVMVCHVIRFRVFLMGCAVLLDTRC